MWIDQVTGAIIDQTETQSRALPSGDVALDLQDLAFTDQTVKDNVSAAKANVSKLSLVALVPWISYVLAVIALIGGIILLRNGGKEQTTAEPTDSNLDGMLDSRSSRTP